MREIKFRAWAGNAGVGPHMILWEKILADNLFSLLIESAGLGRHTLMQFTNLHDKNGKEIYEGDILRWFAAHEQRVIVDQPVIVRWQEDGGRFVVELDGIDENLFQDRTKRWEVIGNIYENPELLESKVAENTKE